MKKLLLVMYGVVMSTALLSCSEEGDEFQSEGVGQLAVESKSSFLITGTDNEMAKAQGDLTVKNVGDAAIEVSSVKTVNSSSRLFFLGEETGVSDCVSDAVCGENNLCVAGRCFEKRAHKIKKLNPNDVLSLQLVVAGGSKDIADCGEAPEGTPPEFVDNYCGHIEVVTTAKNSIESKYVKDGTATFYIQYQGGQGSISLAPPSLVFEGVLLAKTYKQEVVLTNEGKATLRVNSMYFGSEHSQLLSVKPNAPFDIASGESKTIEVVVDTTTATALPEFNTSLYIETSAGTEKVQVKVSSKEVEAPIFSVNNYFLDISSASASVTFANKGTAPLIVNNFKYSDTSSNVYTLANDSGDKVTNLKLAPEASQQLSLKPVTAGNTDNMGLLFKTNDNTYADQTFLFISETSGPLGQMYPTHFKFEKDDSDYATRHFVIRNVGNEDLTINDLGLENSSTDVTIEGITSSTVVKPGDFVAGVLKLANQGTTFSTRLTGDYVGDLSDQYNFDNNRLNQPHNFEVVDANTTQVQNFDVTSPTSVQANRIATFGVNSPSFDSSASCTYLLIDRPATSKVFIHKSINCDQPATFRFDVAGEYKVAVRAKSTADVAEKVVTVTVTN